MAINVVVHWMIPTAGYPDHLINRERIAKTLESRGRQEMGAAFISAAAVPTADGVRASFNFEDRDHASQIVDRLEDLGNGPHGFVFSDVRIINPQAED